MQTHHTHHVRSHLMKECAPLDAYATLLCRIDFHLKIHQDSLNHDLDPSLVHTSSLAPLKSLYP